MSKVSVGAKYLLGLIYFIFGANGFLQFIPVPPMPEAAMNFMGALMATGYAMPFIKGTEVICGVMLLTRVGSPLALVVLAPITLQIFLFHAYLTPGVQGIVIPAIMVVCHVLAATLYWPLYRPLFQKV